MFSAGLRLFVRVAVRNLRLLARGFGVFVIRYKLNLEDEKVMLRICLDAKVFTEYPPSFPHGRRHRAFEWINANPFDDVREDAFRDRVWLWARRFTRWQQSQLGRLYPVVP